MVKDNHSHYPGIGKVKEYRSEAILQVTIRNNYSFRGIDMDMKNQSIFQDNIKLR
jgi:hypothetical protein